ncbi:hypothetical protein ACFWZR_17495 [Streptomyces sp. NPDC059017]|uniref:hypothetical protein n=1 Tax=unclassified Streptomyces TaxID=2593676 RepID=UPI0036ACF189
MSGSTGLAHGVGAGHDLPIPAFHAYAGAFAALLVSFLALGLLWPRSRFRGDRAGRPLPARLQRWARAPALRAGLRALGLAAAATVLLHLLLGPDDPERNPAPGAVYVLLWVGLLPASLLLGPVWRLLNPLRTLHALGCRVVHRPPAEPFRRLPQRLGYRPAAAGLLAFTWLELASPAPASTTALLAFLLAYASVHLAGAAVFGSDWFDRCDAFEAYSGLLARLAPIGRRTDGQLVVRSPLHGLDGTPPAPGLVAVMCVLLGSTAYDGVSDTPSWITTLQTSPLGRTTTATLGLLACTAAVAALYVVGAGAARLMAGPVRRPLTTFAHSLLPIAIGYLVAHYCSLLAVEGPRTVLTAMGSDPAGLPGPEPPLSPGGLATLQVVSVVTGHVLGVVAAHDRSVRVHPPDRAPAGEVPLLVLMIAYTLAGIGLLIS